MEQNKVLEYVIEKVNECRDIDELKRLFNVFVKNMHELQIEDKRKINYAISDRLNTMMGDLWI